MSDSKDPRSVPERESEAPEREGEAPGRERFPGGTEGLPPRPEPSSDVEGAPREGAEGGRAERARGIDTEDAGPPRATSPGEAENHRGRV